MAPPRMNFYSLGEDHLSGLLAGTGHHPVIDPADAEIIILGDGDFTDLPIVPGQVVIDTIDRFLGDLGPLAERGARLARMRQVGGGYWHVEATGEVAAAVVDLLLEEIDGVLLHPLVVYYQILVSVAEMELGRPGYPGADAIEVTPLLLKLAAHQFSDPGQRRFYLEALRRYAQLTDSLELEFWAHEQLGDSDSSS